MDVLRIILALFVPPVAAFMTVGVSSGFWINILLWIVGLHFGGVIHALWLITRQNKSRL